MPMPWRLMSERKGKAVNKMEEVQYVPSPYPADPEPNLPLSHGYQGSPFAFQDRQMPLQVGEVKYQDNMYKVDYAAKVHLEDHSEASTRLGDFGYSSEDTYQPKEPQRAPKEAA